MSESEFVRHQSDVVVPFLPILEKDNYQGNEQE